MQRFYGFLHGIFGKMQRFGVLEIRRGVNNTLDDCMLVRSISAGR